MFNILKAIIFEYGFSETGTWTFIQYENKEELLDLTTSSFNLEKTTPVSTLLIRLKFQL